MKTVLSRFSSKRLLRVSRLSLTALLALAVLAAALPQPAQAATTTYVAPCVTFYTFKSGDTTAKVAQTFGLAWWEIGKANGMTYPYKPTVGLRLCIPPKGWAASLPTITGNVYLAAKGSTLTVTVSGFKYRYLWAVKVKDTTGKVSGDFKVGTQLIPVTTRVTKTFQLPSELRNVTYLTVCLKNLTTDEKICKSVVHLP